MQVNLALTGFQPVDQAGNLTLIVHDGSERPLLVDEIFIAYLFRIFLSSLATRCTSC